VSAEAPLNRQQALQALQSPQSKTKLSGVLRLAKIGQMQDSEALAARLKDRTPGVADAANAALWEMWSRSGDKDIDRLFKRGVQEMSAGNLTQAVTIFSDIVRRRPSFAEGWNKRATLYFMLGDSQKSLADCDEVLKRNPLHFGTLAGYGQLYFQLGDLDKALDYFERAYAINPTMQGVAKNIDGLKDIRQRSRDKMI
jgi:tetratricopeptide (TPR) repeat protein